MDGDLAATRRWQWNSRLGYSAHIADAGTAPPPARARKPAEEPQPAEDAKADGKDGAAAADKQPMPKWKKALYWAVGLVVVALLVVAGVLYWLHARHFETTDDAFVDGNISQVSTQVAGRVIALSVRDNQDVEAGQTLVELDPRDYDVRLRQAEAQRSQAAAQLEQARAQLGLQQAQADQSAANARVSEAELAQATADLARFRAVDPKAISRQQLDSGSASARSAQARLDAARQAVIGARAQVAAGAAQVAAAEANLRIADVTIDNARLQRSYTTLAAPVAGQVTKRTVEVGNYVSPGQSLLAVVPRAMWVTANFKETQLADMRAGQSVRIRVDACPDLDINARVDSFQAGSGSIFSALPAENASGNYVKVVQRVPVKIVFDDPHAADCRMAPGMSVSPRVTVR